VKTPRDVSAADLIRALRPLGYRVTRQVGSHIRVTTDRDGQHHETIPNHAPLKVGTVQSLLRSLVPSGASLYPYHRGNGWPTARRGLEPHGSPAGNGHGSAGGASMAGRQRSARRQAHYRRVRRPKGPPAGVSLATRRPLGTYFRPPVLGAHHHLTVAELLRLLDL
jgi:predicted RNA binding protein YcfA (HicA-like mRNA interferase family)